MSDGFQASLPVTTNLEATAKAEALMLVAVLNEATQFVPTQQGKVIAWKNAAQDAALAIGCTPTEIANETATVNAAAQAHYTA